MNGFLSEFKQVYNYYCVYQYSSMIFIMLAGMVWSTAGHFWISTQTDSGVGWAKMKNETWVVGNIIIDK